MEKITIEKVISFDSVVDSIEYVNVDENIKYKIDDDDSHCEATLLLNGKVKTLLNDKEFNEEVDVDIYAPFDKKLDKNDFKIKVLDYSYSINQKKLTIYLILQLDGIKKVESVEVEQENIDDEIIEQTNEIVENINSVNVINEPVLQQRSTEKENVKIVEDNLVEEMNKSWATDLFNLTDNYSLFMKFHVE